MTHPGSQANSNSASNSSVRAQQQLAWARDELSASHTATIEQIRLNFLRNLNDDSFVPFLSHQEALESLQTDAAGDELTRIPDEFLLAAATKLQSRVQEFRRELPQLPIMVRLYRWRALKRDSWCCPRAEAQLEELFPLLELDFEAIPADAPMLQRLAKFAVETYGMPPKEKADTLAANLAEINKAPNQWRLVARTLRQQCPPIADYADKLLSKTKSEFATPAHYEQHLDRSRGSNRNPGRNPQAANDFIPVENPTAGSGCGNRVGWVAVVFLIVAVRLVFSATNITKSKSEYTPPKVPVLGYQPATGETPYPVGTSSPNETWRVTPSSLDGEEYKPTGVEHSDLKTVREQIEELRRSGAGGSFRFDPSQFEPGSDSVDSDSSRFYPLPVTPRDPKIRDPKITGDPNHRVPSMPKPYAPGQTNPRQTPNPNLGPNNFRP